MHVPITVTFELPLGIAIQVSREETRLLQGLALEECLHCKDAFCHFGCPGSSADPGEAVFNRIRENGRVQGLEAALIAFADGWSNNVTWTGEGTCDAPAMTSDVERAKEILTYMVKEHTKFIDLQEEDSLDAPLNSKVVEEDEDDFEEPEMLDAVFKDASVEELMDLADILTPAMQKVGFTAATKDDIFKVLTEASDAANLEEDGATFTEDDVEFVDQIAQRQPDTRILL